MKKIINVLKYKFSWQTYKDAFFWTFVSIWLFVDQRHILYQLGYKIKDQEVEIDGELDHQLIVEW